MEMSRESVLGIKFCLTLSFEKIAKIIDKFNPNKSAGHDNVENFIIKKVKLKY